MRGKGTDQESCRFASDEMSFLILSAIQPLIKKNPQGGFSLLVAVFYVKRISR